VQGLPSSHAVALLAPGRHAPPPQMSPTVQALLSEQVAVFGRCTQPVAALHESSLHGSPSLQVFSSVTPSQLSSMPLQTSGTIWPGWQLAVQILPVPFGAGAQMPDAQSASTLHGQPSKPPQLVSGPTSWVSSVLASAMSAASGKIESRSLPSAAMSPGKASEATVSLSILPSSAVSATVTPSRSALTSLKRPVPSMAKSSSQPASAKALVRMAIMATRLRVFVVMKLALAIGSRC